MLLNNDLEGINLLDDTIHEYYKKSGRYVAKFLKSENKESGSTYLHYIIDRKHVIRYEVGEDRGLVVGGVELGIGPHYFRAAYFWTYENSERFSIEVSTGSVIHNLSLLDEFLQQK